MNISSALRQVVHGTRWHAKRKSYKVLFWREITPLAVPIFMENACVLLMGVLSTFLVSWLGKDAMAGVGLADSFNMVIMAFFAAIDLGTTVVVAFSLGKLSGWDSSEDNFSVTMPGAFWNFVMQDFQLRISSGR